MNTIDECPRPSASMGHRHPEYLLAKGIGLSILWAIVAGVIAFKRRYLPLIPAEPEAKPHP